MIARWIYWSITYEIYTCRRFSREQLIDWSPSFDLILPVGWLPICTATLDSLFTHTHTSTYVTNQYNLVLAKQWWFPVAGKITTSLVESNRSLLPGLWLILPVGWLPRVREPSVCIMSMDASNMTHWQWHTLLTCLNPVTSLAGRDMLLPSGDTE